jgi:hypothetical protein
MLRNAKISLAQKEVLDLRLTQICVTLPEKVVKKMEEFRDLTNFPISDQIKVLLAGYRVVRISDGREVLGPKALYEKREEAVP